MTLPILAERPIVQMQNLISFISKYDFIKQTKLLTMC